MSAAYLLVWASAFDVAAGGRMQWMVYAYFGCLLLLFRRHQVYDLITGLI
jgi:hypothetical protein